MNMMAKTLQHGSPNRDGKRVEKTQAMSKSDRTYFLELAERAKARLRESGAWQVEIESREDVSARIKKAMRTKEVAADT